MALYVLYTEEQIPFAPTYRNIVREPNPSNEIKEWIASAFVGATRTERNAPRESELYTIASGLPSSGWFITDNIVHAAYVNQLVNESKWYVTYNISGQNLGLALEKTVVGTAGADIWSSTSANERFTGGGDFDLVRFSGARADYKYEKMPDISLVVVDSRAGSPDGADSMIGVEWLGFSDDIVAFDELAAQSYRLYQAAFDRTPDRTGLTYWVDKRLDGLTFAEMVGGFIASAEFKSVYGVDPTPGQIVAKLYQNVLGRNGEPEGVAYWVGQLNRGTSLVEVLAGFSQSGENRANLAPIIGQGVSLDPGLLGF